MFREKDEGINESVFVNLSYVQAQSDYLSGIYPIRKEEAVNLCAFQIFSDFNITVSADIEQTLVGIVDQFIPREIRGTMDMGEVVEMLRKGQGVFNLVVISGRQVQQTFTGAAPSPRR